MQSMTKHLLTPGTWIGRGSFLEKGQSLGTTIECTFDVTSEQVGTHVKGELTMRDGNTRHSFAVWITPNDTGTYDVAAQFAGANLEGTAKMESYPNLGMLWGTRGELQVSCAMFDLRAGRGFRGFSRSPKSQVTWEMVLREERITTTANNVVALGTGKKRK
jgi:hypothetical protein